MAKKTWLSRLYQPVHPVKSSFISRVYIGATIVSIAIVLLIIPWIIMQHIPAVSTTPGYTSETQCGYPYTYEILIGAAAVLSFINWFLSRLLVKNPSHWKVFLLFEVTLLVSTAIVIRVFYFFCHFDPTGYL